MEGPHGEVSRSPFVRLVRAAWKMGLNGVSEESGRPRGGCCEVDPTVSDTGVGELWKLSRMLRSWCPRPLCLGLRAQVCQLTFLSSYLSCL